MPRLYARVHASGRSCLASFALRRRALSRHRLGCRQVRAAAVRAGAARGDLRLVSRRGARRRPPLLPRPPPGARPGALHAVSAFGAGRRARAVCERLLVGARSGPASPSPSAAGWRALAGLVLLIGWQAARPAVDAADPGANNAGPGDQSICAIIRDLFLSGLPAPPEIDRSMSRAEPSTTSSGTATRARGSGRHGARSTSTAISCTK